MALTPIDIDQIIKDWLATREPPLATGSIAVWSEMSARITTAQVRAMQEAGGITAEISEFLADEMALYIEVVLVPAWSAGIEAGRILTPLVARGALTPSTVDAWLLDRQATLELQFTKQQAMTITRLVRFFTLEHPLTAQSLARVLRPAIAFTDRQARTLTTQYIAAVEDGLTGDSLQLRLTQAAIRAQTVRAQRIARTELAAAHNAGIQLTMQDAVTAQVFPGEVERVWRTQRDERVCPICGPLDGEVVDMGQDFTSTGGRGFTGIIPPAHPQCRCVVIYREVEP